MTVLTLGLISDTHVPYRMKRLPDELFEALEGVDLILHAGDVDDPAALESLRRIAPVHAVRGNLHVLDFSDGGASLPGVLELTLAGQRVVLTHGHHPGPPGFWFKGWDLILRLLGGDDGIFNRRIVRRLTRIYPDADVIIFGHSHRVYVERMRRTLLVNPGAVCPTLGKPPTVARVRLGDEETLVEIVSLDSGQTTKLFLAGS